MCGRFILLTDLAAIVEHFDVGETALVSLPAGDLLPGQAIPAVIREGETRLVTFRWGLIPSWARDPAVGRKMINARAETLAEKPSFREALQKRRCLIPADGFYEWTGEKGHRTAVRFRLRSGEPFGFAGLYDTWRLGDAGAPLNTCTIITTESNALVASVHGRMPVILPGERMGLWLDPSVCDPSVLLPLLAPYPAEEMVIEVVAPQPCLV
ncbi:MAG: SOS response-associated peptidase [Syntrophales bacterium]